MINTKPCPKCDATGKLHTIGNGPDSVWMGDDKQLCNHPSYSEKYNCKLCSGTGHISGEQYFEYKLKNKKTRSQIHNINFP